MTPFWKPQSCKPDGGPAWTQDAADERDDTEVHINGASY